MEKKTNMRYQNPSGTEFPILAWNSVPESFTSKSNYYLLRDAGFNLSLTQFSNIDDVENALEAAKDTGVKLIACFPELKSDTVNSVNRLKGYSSLAGWFLGDEGGDKDTYISIFQEIKELSDTISGIDPTHLLYYNLYPTYKIPDYSTYVENYISMVNPQFVSFDNYPIISVGNIERVVRGDFFENLVIIMTSTANRNKPFWAFYMATKHRSYPPVGNNNNSQAISNYPTGCDYSNPTCVYPLPRIEDLRFEAFSALAFGAQCIQCFNYWQPENQKDDEGYCVIFEDSPVYIEGNPTNLFYAVQDINNEIQAVSDVFLGMRLWRIGYIGSICPTGLGIFRDFPDSISVSNVQGKGFLITYFSNNNKDYLLIVNCDVNNSQTITVRLKANVNQIDRDGFISEFHYDQLLNETVEAGDHLLFQFTNY